MGAAEHLDGHLDDELAEVHHLVPMVDVCDEPTVIYSPTGSVLVTRGEHTLRFRTRAAFDADRAALARQARPPRADGLVDFDQLQVRSQVRVAGEWHWVDLVDHAGGRLLLREADEPTARAWWYTPATGEGFTVAEPF